MTHRDRGGPGIEQPANAPTGDELRAMLEAVWRGGIRSPDKRVGYIIGVDRAVPEPYVAVQSLKAPLK